MGTPLARNWILTCSGAVRFVPALLCSRKNQQTPGPSRANDATHPHRPRQHGKIQQGGDFSCSCPVSARVQALHALPRAC
ncbi:hypothetical protein B0T19DRAFT_146212 [Cercophora scortea]|uniref:Uncharacterized protein n=1 Tax=Cercophora scortea TaxID=314031 RepID=A0AAE0IZI3_9PEZI|nr:hypothetical protein B0T19DRAFT_146212 [Cercophora scortea]